MTQRGGVGDFGDDRNIFDVFHQPETDADDNQSDISIDSDIEEGLTSDGDQDSESMGSDRPGSSASNNNRASPGPRSTPDNGWCRDCTGLGANVLPFTEHTGPINDLPLDSLPIDYFHQLIPLAFFDRIANETNLYAQQRAEERATPTVTPTSRFRQTDLHEIKAYIAMHLFMGIVQLPNYRMYWSDDADFNQQFISNSLLCRGTGMRIW